MKKYGRLTLIGYSGNKSACGHKLVSAKCECGNIWEGRLQSLQSGDTKSCGCLEKELKSNRSYVLADATRKFGGASVKGHPLFDIYCVWKGLNSRCNNPMIKGYKDYGGRGIKVCRQWAANNKNGFKNFAKWAEGKFRKGLKIDRSKNDKGYFPSNCRFVTDRISSLNKRSSIKIKFNGISKNQIQWAEYFNVPYQSIYYWRKTNQINKRFNQIETHGQNITDQTF